MYPLHETVNHFAKTEKNTALFPVKKTGEPRNK